MAYLVIEVSDDHAEIILHNELRGNVQSVKDSAECYPIHGVETLEEHLRGLEED